MKEMALIVSTDPSQRFDLAIQLNHLNIALEIAKELDQVDCWRTLGESALNSWKFDLVEECFQKAEDIENLMLFYQVTGNKKALHKLAYNTEKAGKNNIAFTCYLLCQDTKKCVDLLIKSERLPEAAFFAQTYCPSEVPKIVELWKTSLKESKKNVTAECISNPTKNPELYPDYEISTKIEDLVSKFRENVNIPSIEYEKFKDSLSWDLMNDKEKLVLINQLTEEHKKKSSNEKIESDSQNLSHAVSFANTPEIVVNDKSQERPNDLVKNVLSVDEFDAMSHLSLEVNTTGTGSVRNEEFDDISSMADCFSQSGISDINDKVEIGDKEDLKIEEKNGEENKENAIESEEIKEENNEEEKKEENDKIEQNEA
jgi:coatomer subunit beta'